jgi:hypothetical protein
MDLVAAKKMRVRRKRRVCAHHLLLANAMRAINELAPTRADRRDQALLVITYSAFALEALANAFGDRFVPRCSHFESAGLLAKLRVIAQVLNVHAPDFEKEPWSGAKWLVAFRNKIVHAKPQLVELDEKMSEQEYKLTKHDFPESALEKELTKENARRAFNVVEAILACFVERAPRGEADGLQFDTVTGSVSYHHET